MTNDWVDEERERDAIVEAHPRFRQLVREVAIAEQPHMSGLRWLQRNSRTYGIWVTRGLPMAEVHGDLRRRARLLADEIAVELWGTDERYSGERRERAAHAYVLAHSYVRARLRGPLTVAGAAGTAG